MMATEAVPANKLWTEAELDALPEEGFNHEVVDGELVISPKSNFEHGRICVSLMSALVPFVRGHKLGEVLDSSTGLWMRNQNCRAPDVSFIARARLAGIKSAPRAFFRGAPDLAVEVLSPHNTRREMEARLRDYFASGSRLVWIIDPETESVEVCDSLEKRRLIGLGGELTGDPVLPGFRYPLQNLFAPWDWE